MSYVKPSLRFCNIMAILGTVADLAIIIILWPHLTISTGIVVIIALVFSHMGAMATMERKIHYPKKR